ncbi:MAG: valine--tRNA ligase [Thermodesulfobacteriota bacterium]
MSNGKELAKIYEPGAVEGRWSARWLEKRLFTADPASSKEPFTMVIPPPNITGTLHLGHALNNTLQDIMARYKRMRGFNVLWVPGIDHAGIATQNVVEKKLHEEGSDRHKLGRDEFIERVWQWKEESGGAIINQLKRLGSSCDWTRQRFTMDEGLSRSVREVFISLYKEGLIYRGDYIINWCPRCHTALSDLEVEAEETDGSLWHLVYPAKDGKGSITVATTRPETMLGDVAVAVNPEDKRYKKLIGKTLLLPLIGREIPVITDPSVDMEFGTGAVKITPAHDFNDFEMASRHDLPSISIMDMDARMNEAAGSYKGLTRYEAREKVVKDLTALGLLKKTEKYAVRLGSCYRCGTVVEPTLSKQWFVKVKPLAEPAIKAVQDGETVFVPKSWEKTYFEWMRNIRDWCISRQIWWGHRIPAWHCKDCEHITVSTSDPAACEKCGGKKIEQDPDVLDTWFSSALWPFSTLGWPEKTPELKTFYPTSALFTSFDIIFFWVARMMMMGLKFRGEVPFKEVYIHALIRDAEGKKMSKSKGNVIDPLVMMDKYGTDALRFSLAAFAAQGRDIKLAEDRIEGYRNFSNKLWNLARFTLMSVDKDATGGFDIAVDKYTTADKWIITKLDECYNTVGRSIDRYQFDAAARALYSFIWHELCDWYVELVKPDLRGEGGGENGEDRKRIASSVLLSVLEDTMKLLHPFMPFITEEIYSYLPGGKRKKEQCLMEELLPSERDVYPEEAREMESLMEVIKAIRNIRTEMNVPPGTPLDCVCLPADEAGRRTLTRGEGYIKSLARVEGFTIGGEKPEQAAFSIADGVEVYVPLKGLIDVDSETKRLGKELEKLLKDFSSVEKKLSNEEFLGKAPKEIIEKQKVRLEGLREKRSKVEAGLERLKSLGE